MNSYIGDSNFEFGENFRYEFGVQYVEVILVAKKNSFALLKFHSNKSTN